MLRKILPAGLVASACAIAAGCAVTHTIQGATASQSQSRPARIGSAVTLSGNGSGEEMNVTVTRVLASAAPGDEFSSAPAGKQLYAVQFRLENIGSAVYSDAPDNSAVVTDSAGQSYQSAVDSVVGCPSFPGTENIAPGGTGLGCVTFEIPAGAKIVTAQFTLDSGLGPATGQWEVR